jgi:hypothetical protein
MKAASIQEIKQELKSKSPTELIELCLRLARFKKDNKELLTFLLFEEDNRETYISGIKEYTDEAFSEMNVTHVYYAKKSIRKVLRTINKYIRYAGDKTTEVELLLHFVEALKQSGIRLNKSTALENLYLAQVKKIKASIDALHEDLQHDYQRTLSRIIGKD